MGEIDKENAPGKSTGRLHSKEGVSLIIVLGLLSVLTLLAIAFSRSMRTERSAARNYADHIRVKHLVQVALVRAVEDINAGMIGYCYPCWANGDALVSTNASTNFCPDILRGEASNTIPRSLWNDVISATNGCCWTNVISFDGRTNGRIAYLVVNCSGLLDANVLGDTNHAWTTDVVYGLFPEITNDSFFYADCEEHVRYETISELGKLNSGIDGPVSNLFIYSYDPGRDVYFTSTNNLGHRDITLADKLNINDIPSYTNFQGYDCYCSDTNIEKRYWQPLTNLLILAGLTNDPEAVAWNIINYLDMDRVPETADLSPWRGEEGCEAIPLINEIVLHDLSFSTNYEYQFEVELWFPFVPGAVEPADNFRCQIAVFTNYPGTIGTNDDIINNPVPHCWTNTAISKMEFGNSTNEFLTFTSPEFRVFEAGTNVPLSDTNSVWFLARVSVKDGASTIPVDQAMGQNPTRFTGPVGYSVDDPRANGRTNYWHVTTNVTLGATNDISICNPWANGGQGLPIYHRDGLMETIGELGHIYRSGPGIPTWQNINLMDCGEGAHLPDLMTVRATNAPCHGLVSISTAQKDVLRALFYNMEIGYTNGVLTNRYLLADDDIDNLVDAITNGPYLNFGDMFYDGDVADKFAACVPDGAPTNDFFRENTFRNIIDRITFRQNIFTIIVAAEAFGPDGTTHVAEKRAVAIVYRDSYTGRYFTRSFRWLPE